MFLPYEIRSCKAVLINGFMKSAELNGRCLVTLDLDFSDVLRFPPQENYGIVVIRVPHNPTLPLLEQLIRQFLNSLENMPIDKKLWIVETGRIRVHQAEDAESGKE